MSGLALGAGLGCVEVLDETPRDIPRTGTTLTITLDKTTATITAVHANIVTTGAYLPMTASGGQYLATYVPGPCDDIIGVRYRVTYYDQNAGTTKTRFEPADGHFYKRVTGSKPSYCGQGRWLQVNRSADVPDAVVGDGICYAGPPANGCTLRAAVQEANSDGTPDVIVLPSGTYDLTRTAEDDTGVSGDLDLLYDVAIVGPSRAFTQIRTRAERVFDVGPGGRSWVDVTIRGVTLDGLDIGSVIRNAGALRIEDSIVRSGYKSHSGGGCIDSTSYLDIENVEVRDCYAGLGPGGGILVTAGTARVRRASFHDNYAVQHGGAIAVIGTGTLTLEDSTLYQNTASVYGGGLFVNGDLDANVRNVTMTQNVAHGSGSFGLGGGIFQGPGAGQISISNSIVAENYQGSGLYYPDADCKAELTSFGGNIIGIGSTDCVVDDTYASGTDQIGEQYSPVNPYLSSTSGWPPAKRPSASSPAIDAGASGNPNQADFLRCTRRDQQGAVRTSAAGCDSGAVERP